MFHRRSSSLHLIFRFAAVGDCGVSLFDDFLGSMPTPQAAKSWREAKLALRSHLSWSLSLSVLVLLHHFAEGVWNRYLPGGCVPGPSPANVCD